MAFDETEDKIISVKLEKSVADRASEIAKIGDITRQRFIYNLIKIGADSVMNNCLHFKIAFLALKMKNIVFQREDKQIVVIPLKLESELIDKIDFIASNWSTTRHDAMKQIITVGVDETSNYDRLGLLRASLLVGDIEDIFKSIFTKSEALYKSIDDEERRLNRLSHDR